LNKFQNAYASANADAGSNSIAADFAEEPDYSPKLGEDVVGPLQELSWKYCTAVDGSASCISTKARRCLDAATGEARATRRFACYANRKMEIDGKMAPLGKAWFESADRPSAIAFTFDTSASPAADTNARIKDGRLKLWTGYGIKPNKKANGWKLFEAMIRNDLCAGKSEYYDYVIKWIAHKI